MPEPDVTKRGESVYDTAVAPPEGGSLIDAGADLVEAVVSYVRQEAEDVVQDKVVRPTQKAGVTVALALAIATVISLGTMFVSAGLLILLARGIGWPGALLAVGGVLLLGAAALAYVRTRSVQ